MEDAGLQKKLFYNGMYLRNASQWTQGAVINRNLPLALTKKIPQQHVFQIYRFINHPLGSQ